MVASGRLTSFFFAVKRRQDAICTVPKILVVAPIKRNEKQYYTDEHFSRKLFTSLFSLDAVVRSRSRGDAIILAHANFRCVFNFKLQ